MSAEEDAAKYHALVKILSTIGAEVVEGEFVLRSGAVVHVFVNWPHGMRSKEVRTRLGVEEPPNEAKR